MKEFLYRLKSLPPPQMKCDRHILWPWCWKAKPFIYIDFLSLPHHYRIVFPTASTALACSRHSPCLVSCLFQIFLVLLLSFNRSFQKRHWQNLSYSVWGFLQMSSFDEETGFLNRVVCLVWTCLAGEKPSESLILRSDLKQTQLKLNTKCQQVWYIDS